MRPTVIAIPASKEAHVQQHYLPPATITLDLNEIFSNEEQVNDFFEKARIGDEASSILHQVEQIICAEGLRQVRWCIPTSIVILQKIVLDEWYSRPLSNALPLGSFHY